MLTSFGSFAALVPDLAVTRKRLVVERKRKINIKPLGYIESRISLEECKWSTFDPEHTKVILGTFGALVSVLALAQKQLKND